MHFLPDVYVPCEQCHGKRYNRETLDIRFKGKTISDVLEMSVEEALEFFSKIPKIKRRLQTLHDVGLDYIRLGQPATTLSGGEAQRIKLSSELSKVATGDTLYILDEPTTGLHFADVQRLLDVLGRLVDVGNTVVVIEHNLDVIKTADWIIDLGPEGGEGGGELVAAGTPEQVAARPSSRTPASTCARSSRAAPARQRQAAASATAAVSCARRRSNAGRGRAGRDRRGLGPDVRDGPGRDRAAAADGVPRLPLHPGGPASSAVVFRRPLRRLPPEGWRAGLVMGVFLTAGYVAQTLGLQHTTASNAGFITGLFVVLTPLFGALLFGIRAGTGSVAGGAACRRSGCCCSRARAATSSSRATASCSSARARSRSTSWSRRGPSRASTSAALVAIQLDGLRALLPRRPRRRRRPRGAPRRHGVERADRDVAGGERARLPRAELRAAAHARPRARH